MRFFGLARNTIKDTHGSQCWHPYSNEFNEPLSCQPLNLSPLTLNHQRAEYSILSARDHFAAPSDYPSRLSEPQENVSPSALDESETRDPEQLAARRQHIVTELLDTERTYVAELNQILKVRGWWDTWGGVPEGEGWDGSVGMSASKEVRLTSPVYRQYVDSTGL